MRRALILSSTGHVVYSGAPAAAAAGSMAFNIAPHTCCQYIQVPYNLALDLPCNRQCFWPSRRSVRCALGRTALAWATGGCCIPGKHHVLPNVQAQWRRRGGTLQGWVTTSPRTSTSRMPSWTLSSAARRRRCGSLTLCRYGRFPCHHSTHINEHHLDVAGGCRQSAAVILHRAVKPLGPVYTSCKTCHLAQLTGAGGQAGGGLCGEPCGGSRR